MGDSDAPGLCATAEHPQSGLPKPDTGIQTETRESLDCLQPGWPLDASTEGEFGHTQGQGTVSDTAETIAIFRQGPTERGKARPARAPFASLRQADGQRPRVIE